MSTVSWDVLNPGDFVYFQIERERFRILCGAVPRFGMPNNHSQVSHPVRESQSGLCWKEPERSPVSNPMGRDTSQQTRLVKAPPNLALNISRHPCQCTPHSGQELPRLMDSRNGEEHHHTPPGLGSTAHGVSCTPPGWGKPRSL